MLVVDGNGLPLGFHPDSANYAEVRLAQQTLGTIRVARPQGRHKQRPQKLEGIGEGAGPGKCGIAEVYDMFCLIAVKALIS
jgi:hypothetical protein